MAPSPPPPPPKTATLLTLPPELRLKILALALCLPAQHIFSPCACLRPPPPPPPNTTPSPALPPLPCSPPTALLARWQAEMQASLESRVLMGSLSRVCRAVHAEVLALRNQSQKRADAITFLFCTPKCLQFALDLMTPRQRVRTRSLEVLHWKRSLPAAFAVGVEAVRGFVKGEVGGKGFEVGFREGGWWDVEEEEEGRGRGRGKFLVVGMEVKGKVRVKGEGAAEEEEEFDSALTEGGRVVNRVERRVCESPACTAA